MCQGCAVFNDAAVVGLSFTGPNFRIQGLPRWTVSVQGFHNAASVSTLPQIEVEIQGYEIGRVPKTKNDLNFGEIQKLLF